MLCMEKASKNQSCVKTALLKINIGMSSVVILIQTISVEICMAFIIINCENQTDTIELMKLDLMSVSITLTPFNNLSKT